MAEPTMLPHINAVLNSLTVILVSAAYFFIRRGDKVTHRKIMLTAVGVSALFLVLYVFHHLTRPYFVFTGEGWIRPIYFTMLYSHIVLAALMVPMIVFTLIRALRGTFEKHKAIARWTFPVWVYVSATGVVIYVMLYHIYTDAAV